MDSQIEFNNLEPLTSHLLPLKLKNDAKLINSAKTD
jgi:hypothetical protein